VCGRFPVVNDRRPAANAAAFLSLPPTVRGALWRGLWPFWLPRDAHGMSRPCADRRSIRRGRIGIGASPPGRAHAMLESSGQQAIAPTMVREFAMTARWRMRIEGGYRRDHLPCARPAGRVADKEVRIMGSKGDSLRTLAAASGAKSATPGVRSSVLKWRRERNWHPTFSCPIARRLLPLPAFLPFVGQRRRWARERLSAGQSMNAPFRGPFGHCGQARSPSPRRTSLRAASVPAARMRSDKGVPLTARAS
jgi:hypothetical protein